MKYALLAILLTIAAKGSHACDGCGSGAGQAGWGIMPSNNQHFIGLRMRSRSFLTEPHSIGFMHSDGSDDSFIRTEINGRYSFNSGVMLLASIPYNTGRTGQVFKRGLGDISLTVASSLLKPNESKNVKHQILAGIGVETPTGDFEFNHEIPAVVQQGSGSWDLTGMLMYTLRHKNHGIQMDCNYKYSGINPEHYQFGQMIMGGVRLFSSFDKNSWRFVPSIALSQEAWAPDVQDTRYDVEVPFTGGNLLMASGSFDLFSRRFSVGFEYGRSLHSHIAEGYSSLKHNVHVRLLIFLY